MVAFDSPPTLPASSARRPEPRWQRRLASRLVVTDLLVLIWAILGAAYLTVRLEQPVDGAVFGWVSLNYVAVCLGVLAVWMAALAAVGSRRPRSIGTGTLEFKALAQSTLVVLFVICLLVFVLKIDVSRAFVLVVLPLGLVALMVGRVLWRQWLRLHRQRGAMSSRVLLVGSGHNAARLASELRTHSAAGYHVVGALLTDQTSTEASLTGLPVFRSIDQLLSAVVDCGADTVFVTDGHNLPPAKLRELSWSLEPGRQHLVMAPSLTDIAGPRVHARPVAGLPLVHVETPRYEGADQFVKRAFDICVSAGILLVLSVPLLVVMALIKITSPGPLFFSHERIGKNGEPFRMLKFRSMIADADAGLAELLARQGTADTPLFKIENDPRITPIGRYLRRYSVDEIPQLLNVVAGRMSLVGPRPQVQREVQLYDHAAARRLFVKPGMTGLWQVSGRSNLNWEESVRLDLFYVENWSLSADLAIMVKTVRAVLAKDGAV